MADIRRFNHCGFAAQGELVNFVNFATGTRRDSFWAVAGPIICVFNNFSIRTEEIENDHKITSHTPGQVQEVHKFTTFTRQSLLDFSLLIPAHQFGQLSGGDGKPVSFTSSRRMEP
jgi:hypothetical protein